MSSASNFGFCFNVIILWGLEQHWKPPKWTAEPILISVIKQHLSVHREKKKEGWAVSISLRSLGPGSWRSRWIFAPQSLKQSFPGDLLPGAGQRQHWGERREPDKYVIQWPQSRKWAGKGAGMRSTEHRSSWKEIAQEKAHLWASKSQCQGSVTLTFALELGVRMSNRSIHSLSLCQLWVPYT